MSLRIRMGRSGTGKTARLYDEIHRQLIDDPKGPPIWLIVPDQMTFHTEKEINNLPGVEGVTRLNVFSFSRLALRVLENVGGATRPHLSQIGVAMLIRKAVEEEKDTLRIFKKAADQQGFYDVLQRTFSEFKRYDITEEMLEDKHIHLSGEASISPLLVDKLYDLQKIYAALNLALKDKYIDSDDYLTFAAEKLPSWEILNQATIYLDGFDSFTPQELSVIQVLMQQGKEVILNLTLDPLALHQLGPGATLFKRAIDTYQRIIQLADYLGVSVVSPEMFLEQKRSDRPMLKHLERHYEKRPYQVLGESDGTISLLEATNRRIEIEEVARSIQQLVREKGKHYRDITILVRDLSKYKDLIETIFSDYNIPLFSDQKRTMHHHPLIELIRSSLEAILQNWRYEPVFRAFKTDLLFPMGENLVEMRAELDQLENHVLAYGINGKQWKSNEPWNYRETRGLEEDASTIKQHEVAFGKKLNHWRYTFSDPLLAFEMNMKKAKTIEAKCSELYWFLEGLGVPEKIENLRNRAEEEGRLSEAREHDQAWQAVLEVLDQLVEVAGKEEVSLDLFSKILDSGLESLRFSLVPPAIDQVLVGSMDRSRVEGTKVLFVLGVNEGVLPAKPMEEGLLTDDERIIIEETGVRLAPTAREQLFYEDYLIYRALASPTEQLILTYPLATEEGQTLMPSSLIRRIGQFFTDLKPKLVTGEPFEMDPSLSGPFIVPSMRTLSYTAQALRRFQNGYPIDNKWWETYNFFISSEKWRPLARRIFSSHFYRNDERPLPKDLAEALYGRDIQASVSRMERFNSCPFSQFVSYGLRLKEREIYRLDAPDIGQLFHSALKLMTEDLRTHQKEWALLTKEECHTLAKSTVEVLVPKLQRQILLSSARYHYLKHKLEEIVARAAVVLSKHASVSGFSPVGLELPFGPGQDLPPLTFNLPNGGTMQLVGRIDRVDKGETETGLYLRIIDYKSGKKGLNLSEVYFGLALQMLAYLDVVLTHSNEWLGKKADPAGVLYFHVHNPILNEQARPDGDTLEDKLLSEFRMKGLLLEEEVNLRLMDSHLETGTSHIAPFGFKKDGTLTKASTVATRDQFDQLRQYTRRIFEKVGSEIVSGTIQISPYQLKGSMPCTYCTFKSICHYDPSQPGNEPRILYPDSEEDQWEKMRRYLSHEQSSDERQVWEFESCAD